MQVIYVDCWEDFILKIQCLDGWAFRGEVSSEWALMTSLSRKLIAYCPDQTMWPLREARALRIFRRKAHNYMADPHHLEDDLRCLALMQHHGSPTRLLDFSKSPYVASFFALESSTQSAAVYALNTPALWNLAPQAEPTLTREVLDPRIPGNYERYYLKNRLSTLWFGEPTEMDRRLVAQSGLFVVPGRLDIPIESILANYGPPEELLLKFVLPHGVRATAMQALYRMNVTYSTLFPDLEGLARASAYELEIVWDRLMEDFKNLPSSS